MPLYMIEFAYTSDALNALIRKPEDRTAAVDAIVRSAGGRLQALYYHFGEYDGTAIADVPDDISANAVAVAVGASGAIRATKTTRLFSPKEIVEAFTRAGKLTYQPPGRK
jgi:uncharacterized protein with GYD domain